VTRRTTRRPGEISLAPGSRIDKGHSCSCWPKPDDARPCTPQTCDWRCRACRIHGQPFYSHGDLQYLEHGTGPLAAELDRLWRAKGTMKGGTTRQGPGHDGDGWQALPRGTAGLAPRRPHARTVTELYYPGLQDPPPGHHGRNAGSGQQQDVRFAASPACLAGLRRVVRTSLQQLPAAIEGDVVDNLVLAVSEATTNASRMGPATSSRSRWPSGCKAAGSRRRSVTGAAPHPAPLPLTRPCGRGLWLIGQLVDELRLAKARPGTPVTLRRCIPRRLRRLGELRDGRVGINE
jgi:hypothetical protein